MTYAAAPAMTYLQQQPPMQYVNEQGQPCTADGMPLQQYVNEQGQPCTADGIPLQVEQPVQYVNEQGLPCTANGQLLQLEQPVQYVNEHGQLCTADGQLLPAGASMQVAQPIYGAPFQPTAFNISPEIFAKLAQGGALTPEDLAAT